MIIQVKNAKISSYLKRTNYTTIQTETSTNSFSVLFSDFSFTCYVTGTFYNLSFCGPFTKLMLFSLFPGVCLDYATLHGEWLFGYLWAFQNISTSQKSTSQSYEKEDLNKKNMWNNVDGSYTNKLFNLRSSRCWYTLLTLAFKNAFVYHFYVRVLGLESFLCEKFPP